jgi:hypothetical protein
MVGEDFVEAFSGDIRSNITYSTDQVELLQAVVGSEVVQCS